MALDLNELGLTQEDLQQRVVDRLCDRLLSREMAGEEGDIYLGDSNLKHLLDKAIQQRIDAAMNAVADKYILPNATQRIESLMLQETNQWGEKKGQPLSFTEYLIKRADAYMQEKVNYEGKSKDEANGYSWDGKQTRLTYIMHRHIQHHIGIAMKEMLGGGLEQLGKALEQTCQLQMRDLTHKVMESIKRA
jgi:hypothetical protein